MKQEERRQVSQDWVDRSDRPVGTGHADRSDGPVGSVEDVAVSAGAQGTRTERSDSNWLNQT